MVMVSSSGLSHQNQKRPLETGYCSSSLDHGPKYKARKVSAVRDFPPGCGRKLDEPAVTLPMVESAMSDEVVQASIEKSSSPQQLQTSNNSVKEENSSLIKKKYHSRRVSAVRDFPPFCGRNAPKPAKSDCKDTAEVVTVIASTEDQEGVHDSVAVVGKEITVYSLEETAKCILPDDDTCLGESDDAFDSSNDVDLPLVQALMARPFCPWRQGSSSDGVKNEGEGKKEQTDSSASYRKKYSAVAKKSGLNPVVSRKSLLKKKKSVSKAADRGAVGSSASVTEVQHRPHKLDVILPPFGPNASTHGDSRSRVRETLRLFQVLCRKLLQGEESKSRTDEEGQSKHKLKRIDLEAAKIIKAKGKEVNTDGIILGEVPGVEAGDEFQYRVELALVGIHRLYQAGIDSMKYGDSGMLVAVSIVASGAYADEMDDPDVLVYSGQGGNVVGKSKTPEDQKLERGNLALRNSISTKNPVRVIRGYKEIKPSEAGDAKSKVATTYVYDGLYTVENYWTEEGKHGKMVFMFELRRVPGQADVFWKEVKSSKKSTMRHGVCVDDITGGKELFPVCAINRIDAEKPPQFKYIRDMKYPEWFHPSPLKGCDCSGRCSDSKKCLCAVRNGGEIPYNRNGAIVEVKPLVYECGPHCKCPPSCYNRVGQNGIKIQLEIFKTESRGWGVRSLTSIPSGTFICEYVGELLEDKEAERRIGNDEYLFDIGQNYSDCSINPSGQNCTESDAVEDVGYTIDAADYGNVGRFINHSCSPNLYAQNVLYDYEDKRMPHIMLFAADNIPPLRELTYHYNYTVDQVRDSDGNIKVKKCFCGSAECTGRLY